MIELLITIAIIGIVSALALPAYRTYVETANMSKVNAAYENAIRVVQQEYQKKRSRAALGLSSTWPSHRREWPEILDPGGTVQAPGGGPIYNFRGKNRVDYDGTGAVRINMPNNGSRVDIFRPAYAELTPLRARITSTGVQVRELKNPNDDGDP